MVEDIRGASRADIRAQAEAEKSARAERLGSRMSRLRESMFGPRSQEQQDQLEAYRTQTPIDEIRRRRGSIASPVAEAPSTVMPSPAVGPFQSRGGVMAGEGTEEVSAANVRDALNTRNQARRAAANRPNTRMAPSRGMARASAPVEMSADDLNALSLARGEGEGAAAANIRRRLAEMEPGMKKGGRVKKMAKGGAVKVSAARRGDGCITKGKTKGRMV
jgi:hypothetical protein